MTITIRLADPSADYEAVAALLSAVQPEPVTAEQLRSWDALSPQGFRRRMIAVDEMGQIVGYSLIGWDDWSPQYKFQVDTVVDRAHRGHGIGTALYDDLIAEVRARGGQQLRAEVREGDSGAREFAEKRGFSLQHHLFESTIDLRQFDPTPYQPLLDTVSAAGIRIFSLADAGNTDEVFAKLYAVNRATAFDIPGSDQTFPSLEEFNGMVRKAAWFVPEGQLLAADGDQVIGLSAVGYFADTNAMYNMMTGVLPEYRGRKIAQALKVRALTFAKAFGADYIRTHNESTNTGMLAINRKLGYVPEPGVYVMSRTLDTR